MKQTTNFLIFFFLLFFILLLSVYSVDIDSCQILNSGSYELNTSIIHSGSNCFNISGNNVILDCQGNNITLNSGGSYYGIYLTGDNVQISNCIISNFSQGIRLISNTNTTIQLNTVQHSVGNGIYLSGSTNNTFYLNRIENNSGYGIGAFSTSSNNNITSNVLSGNNYAVGLTQSSNNNFLISNTIKDNFLNGIFLSYSNNNLISLNTVTGNGIGFRILGDGEGNNLTLNNITENINYNINMNSGISGPYQNLIYNNNLGNISKIYSDDWSYWDISFNLSTQGNTYYNNSAFGTGLTYCFGAGNCDYGATITAFPLIITPSITSSLFPIQGFLSVLTLISLLFLYFN